MKGVVGGLSFVLLVLVILYVLAVFWKAPTQVQISPSGKSPTNVSLEVAQDASVVHDGRELEGNQEKRDDTPGPSRIERKRDRDLALETFDAVVRWNGQVVAGARVLSVEVEMGEDGRKEGNPVFGVLSALSSGASVTDTMGVARVNVRPSRIEAEEFKESDLFEVLAYHPEIGSGYREVTVGEVRAGIPIAVELDRGTSIIGRLVDPGGRGVEGARVEIGVIWERELACCEGLGTVTRADGSFEVLGILEKNRPYVLHVRYHPEDNQYYQRSEREQLFRKLGPGWIKTAESGCSRASLGAMTGSRRVSKRWICSCLGRKRLLHGAAHQHPATEALFVPGPKTLRGLPEAGRTFLRNEGNDAL